MATALKAVEQTPDVQLSPRAILIQHLEERYKDAHEIRIPEAVTELHRAFDNDLVFRRSVVEWFWSQAAYDVVQEWVGKGRRPRQSMVTLNPQTAETLAPARLEALLTQPVRSWAAWWERSGYRHVKLMSMTRDDLEKARERRRESRITETALERLWDTLLSRLEDKTVTVGERWSEEEIDREYRTAYTEAQGER